MPFPSSEYPIFLSDLCFLFSRLVVYYEINISTAENEKEVKKPLCGLLFSVLILCYSRERAKSRRLAFSSEIPPGPLVPDDSGRSPALGDGGIRPSSSMYRVDFLAFLVCSPACVAAELSCATTAFVLLGSRISVSPSFFDGGDGFGNTVGDGWARSSWHVSGGGGGLYTISDDVRRWVSPPAVGDASGVAGVGMKAFVPLLFSSGDGGVGPGDEGLRLVCIPLLAKGMDLICSPVSFFFCVGGSVVGARLLFWSLVSSSVMADRLLLFLDLDDDGRCAWEAVYSASMPGSKSSSAVSSTSWGSRRVAWASCSFGRCASSPMPADSEEVRCPGAMREDPRTLFLNLNGLKVLYANLHLWRMGMTYFIVNFFSSRVLVVKSGLL